MQRISTIPRWRNLLLSMISTLPLDIYADINELVSNREAKYAKLMKDVEEKDAVVFKMAQKLIDMKSHVNSITSQLCKLPVKQTYRLFPSQDAQVRTKAFFFSNLNSCFDSVGLVAGGNSRRYDWLKETRCSCKRKSNNTSSGHDKAYRSRPQLGPEV